MYMDILSGYTSTAVTGVTEVTQPTCSDMQCTKSFTKSMPVLNIGLFRFSLSFNPCFPAFYTIIAFKSYIPPTFS